MIPIIIVIAVLLVILIWIAGTYNSLIRNRNNCEEGYATMDVYLKKRFDLIPNLVETVKGYAKHESGTLKDVTEARGMISRAGSVEERAKGEGALTGALKSLFAVAEAYPQLQANRNFLDLQEQLKKIEEDIANARKYYNAVVKNYNNRIEMFPGNIVASMFHFTKKTMFEVSDETERKNVKVDFGA